MPQGTSAVLAFDGLDTFATVRLNGQEILQSDNMFVPRRVSITEDLNVEGENVLEIEFESALLKARLGLSCIRPHLSFVKYRSRLA